jgi:filamentous hemagglutinin family protein
VNKIHNVIWSTAQNAWVVVAEGTKRSSKSGAKALSVMIALIVLSPAGATAATLPQGGVISVGEGTIVNTGNNKVTIKQSTDKLGVNWQSFNVGADGQVVFEQPNSKSVALNRVIGSDGSAILGKIDANGQVILINPNGVIVGKDAQVNVGGLVASTLNLTDENFKKGDYSFKAEGENNGQVLNLGTIQSAEGGYVALLGKSVKNQGIIKAKLGTAAMAAGNAVTLDFAGDGLLNIQVKESAVNALVENKGLIKADGGSVLMTARASNALLNTVVNNEGVIEAQTLNSREGKIFLDGGMEGGKVEVAGTLDASAPVAGNGGFIETSGQTVQVKKGAKITTLAKNGKSGKWLLDPTDFNIFYGDDSLTESSIGAGTLADALEHGNVELQTSSAGGGVGNIGVYADINWSANTVLTLTAHEQIRFGGGNINATGDSAGVVLNTGAGGYFVGNIGYWNQINLPGLNATFSLNGQAYKVLHSITDIQNIKNDLTGFYVLGNDIDASITSSWNGGLGFDPLGNSGGPGSAFTGALQGLGHTITGLTIKRPTEDYVGLFGYTSGATFKYITVSGASIIGKDYTGTLAGYSDSTKFNNINITGALTGANHIGGMAGAINNGVVFQATSTSSIEGVSDVGGLAGEATGNTSVDYSTYDGNVHATGDRVGGLVGNKSTSTIATYNRTTGSVVGRNNTGGLYGQSSTGNVWNSWSNSSVFGLSNVGGLIGWMSGGMVSRSYSTGSVEGSEYVGGLIGNANSGADTSYSFSFSPVKSANYGGGLFGTLDNASVNNSYAVGDVTAPKSGGLIGLSNNGSVTNTYSTGKANAGLINTAVSGTVTNSFWNLQTSGASTSAGGTGKTDAQMKTASTYSGWTMDVANAGWANWRLYEGNGFPLLTFLMPTATLSTSMNTTYNGSNIVMLDISSILSSFNPVNTFPFPVYDNSFNNAVTSGGVAVRNAGTYTLDNNFASNQFGYNFNVTGPITLTVDKLQLSAAVDNLTKTYDGTVNSGGNLLKATNGLVLGDDVSILTSDATYSSKNAGSNLTINFGHATLSGADAGNYTLEPSSFTNGTYSRNDGVIVAKNLNLGLVADNKTYDGTTSSSVTIHDDRIAGDDLSIGFGSSAFADKNAGTGKTVSVNGIVVTGADAGNYTWSTSETTTADIGKATLNVSATGNNKTYDGTTNTAVNLTDNRIGSDSLTVSSSSAAFSDKNAGNGKTITVGGITVTGADAGNYTWNTSANTSADITKAALNVSATGVNKTYDGNTSANVNLTDNRIGSDVLSVNAASKAFSDKNAGTGKGITVSGITVTGADAGNYTWNTSVATSADIAKAALTVTATGVNKTYDGTTNAGATFTDNRVGADNLAISATGSVFADKNAGLGKTVTVSGINVTGIDAGNYTWNTSAVSSADIAKAALSVTAAGVNKTYNGSTAATVNFTDNRMGSDDLTLGSSSALFADKNAGNGKNISVSGITVSGADAGNYTWNTSAVTSANIAKAALNVTANGVNKTYDGTTGAAVSLVDDRIGSDDLSTSATSKNFADKNAGLSKNILVSGINVTGADAGNYTWNSTTSTTADIAKAALSVTAAGVNKTYDGSTVATVNFTDNRIGSDDLTLGSSSASFTDKNAGNGKNITVSGITASGADAGNYTWNTSAITSANIAKAALNVTANGGNKVYDGTTGAAVSLSDDRIGSDDLSISAASKNFSDKNAGLGKTVTVTGINVTGTDAGNYTWNTSAATSADIAKAALSVTAAGVNKTYDGSAVATVNLTDNRIGSDDLTLGSSGALFSDKNAGNGKNITVNGITLSGADAGNYTWNASAVTSANIAKAALNVTANGVNKTYDGTTGASVNFGDNRIGSDDLSISAASKNFADKNAGLGKTVTVSGINVTGADAGNYTWNTSAVSSADIAKAALTVTAAGVNKTYDGSTVATVNLSDNRIGSDDLTLGSSSALFADKNAGNGKNITASGITVSGADAGNYTWNTSAVTSANIAKAALNVTASGVNKTYDGSAGAAVIFGDDRIGTDDLSISAVSKNFADKNAGLGKNILVNGINITGTDAGNYTWNASTATSADIAKAALSVSAIGVNKTYDGTTIANANLSDNRIGADNLILSATGKNFTDKNAGVGKAITVNGINVTGADAANYTWNTTAYTTADIAKAALNITATGVNKTYDGSSAATANLSDNRVGGDNLVLSAAGSSFADKNAGGGKTVTVNGISVTGADSGNYTWNTSAMTTADIAKAVLNIGASGVNKSYDGTTFAGINFSDNRVTGDSLSVSGVGAFSDKNAGASKSISVSGINVTGVDAGNYSWNTLASTAADIAKAQLIVKAQNGSKTEGDADGALIWNLQSGSLFGSDSINGTLSRDAGEVAGQYAINKGTLDAGTNYDLAFIAGTYDISAAGIPPVTPPVTPPVIIDPITPPVVVPPKPPVTTPTVNVGLDQARDIIANISVAIQTPGNTVLPASDSSTTALGDYRLVNFGMKLPEDMTQDERASN